MVGAVVAEADHEARRLLPVREHVAHVQALVHSTRAHLDHAVPEEHLGGRAGEVLAEVVQELVRAPGAVLGLGLAVVPGDAARLPLDVRAGHVPRDAPQQPLDGPHPGEVELDQRPPLLARPAREVAVLRAEMDGQRAEPLLEVPAPAPADDVDVRLRQRRETPQQLSDLLRRDRQVGMRLDLPQRPVVVEEHRARPGAYEPPLEPLARLALDVGRRLAPRPAASRVAPEPREEAVRPLAAVEGLHALRHRLEPPSALREVELERGAEPLDDAVHVPRVDEERARQHLRRARELGEEQRPAPATRQARLRLAEHELVRDEVHPVAERRHHHHVRAAVQRDEPVLRDVAVQVLDRCRAGLTETAVDARDQQLDVVPLLLVLRALEPRGDEHLEHRRRQRSRRILLEQALVREQLLRDALRVVEPFDAEDEACGPRTAPRAAREDDPSPGPRASPGTRWCRSRSGRRRCRPCARRPRSRRAPSRCRGCAGTRSGSAARSRRPGS